MSNDRTAEIWATRLQREVLALTSPRDNSEKKDSSKLSSDEGDDVSSHATPKHDNLNIATLPPFVKVHGHELNLDAGICNVTFAVQLEVPQAGAALASPISNDNEINNEESMASKAGSPPTKTEIILVTLDASMEEAASHHLVCYPFQKPRVLLASGSEFFPAGSSIRDSDYIDLDCDWTPSLHLSDAILNVALKIRESIKRGDPFFAATDHNSGGFMDDGSSGVGFLGADRVANVADEISNSVSNFLGSLRRKGEGIRGVDRTSQSQNNTKAETEASSDLSSPNSKSSTVSPNRSKPLNQVKYGDVINLNLPPYSQCVGMYSCKAIRRPQFVEKAIAQAELKATEALQEESRASAAAAAATDNTDASNATARVRRGFMGASTFLKSIEKTLVQSTKSLVEEHYLMVTDTHLLEVKSSKFNLDQATVTFVSPISLLTKLKFRREESVSLFFKQSADDPLIYVCPESADAVNQIQTVLKRHGVRGKHTTSATQKQIQLALKMVSLIRSKEAALDANDDDSVKDKNKMLENVNEIMDLYRQAAERFESAGDARHEEVITHMQNFLAKPLTTSILDGSYVPPPVTTKVDSTDEDDVDQGKAIIKPKVSDLSDKNSYEDTMKTVDDMMKEVENLGLDPTGDEDTDMNDFFNSSDNIRNNLDEHDPIADLDAMLSEADKELNDIINGTD